MAAALALCWRRWRGAAAASTRSGDAGDGGGTSSGRREELQARWERCQDALEELQAEAYRLDAGSAAATAAQLQQQAADLAAQLSRLGERPPPPAARRRWPVPLALAAVAAGLWWQLGEQAQKLPQAPTPPAVAGEVDVKQIRALSEQLGADPDNLALTLRLGHLLLRAQMLEEAKVINDRALRLQPDNLEARVHAAVLAAAAGEPEAAGQRLAELCGEAPTFAEAWFFRGMLALQAQDLAAARSSLERFVQLAEEGPHKERIKAMVAGLPP